MMASCNARTIRDESGDLEWYLQVEGTRIQEAPVIAATSRCMSWNLPEAKVPINQAIQHILIPTKLYSPSIPTSDIIILNFNLANNKWCEIIDGLTTAGAFASTATDAAQLKATVLNKASSLDTHTLQLNPGDV